MINLKFKPLVTTLTVSKTTTKENVQNNDLISKSSSNIEFGKIISYRNREEYGNYRRI